MNRATFLRRMAFAAAACAFFDFSPPRVTTSWDTGARFGYTTHPTWSPMRDSTAVLTEQTLRDACDRIRERSMGPPRPLVMLYTTSGRFVGWA